MKNRFLTLALVSATLVFSGCDSYTSEDLTAPERISTYGVEQSLQNAGTGTLLDVFESPDLVTPVGLIETIATAQTGAQHYNYVGVDGFPTGVNFGPRNANLYVHENTNTGEFTFGLIFGEPFGGAGNTVSFEIEVFGSLNDPFISQQDDPFDVGCTAAPSSGALESV